MRSAQKALASRTRKRVLDSSDQTSIDDGGGLPKAKNQFVGSVNQNRRRKFIEIGLGVQDGRDCTKEVIKVLLMMEVVSQRQRN